MKVASHRKLESIRTLYPFLSTAGLHTEMKLKLRLLLVSLIHVQCQLVFCFRFCNLPFSSICCYMLTAWLDILGHSISHFWDCPQNITDPFGMVCNYCFSLIPRPVLLPDMGLLQCRFKIIIIVLCKSVHTEFYSVNWVTLKCY